MTEDERLGQLLSALERHGATGIGGAAGVHRSTPEAMAREWMAAGFDDTDEVEEWLSARCFTPQGAQALERAGITPEQAALRTTAGSAGYEDTIGYKLTAGDLSFDEARRIITAHFWNS